LFQPFHRFAPFSWGIGRSKRSIAALRSNRLGFLGLGRALARFGNSRNVERLTIIAAAKKSSDLVVVAEERDEKLGASVLKDESEIAVAAAFEELAS
jgi:hypothetical protein